MRKEIIFAIIAGIVFGLVLALGVWRANTALEEPPTEAENTVQTIEEKQIDGDLTISKPDNYSVFTKSPIILNGITSPNTWLAISAQTTQYTVLSNNLGEFEEEVELQPGLNRIVVTSFVQNETPHEQIVSVVYSEEFGSKSENEE